MQEDHLSSCQDSMVDQSQEHLPNKSLPSQEPEIAGQKAQKNLHGSKQHNQINHNSETNQFEKKQESKSEIIQSIQQALVNKVAYFEEKGDKKARLLYDMKFYFEKELYRNLGPAQFSQHICIPSKNDEDRLRFGPILQEMKSEKNYSPAPLGLSPKQSRGIAAILGMAICDALGASTQFQHFKKEGLGVIKNGFDDIQHGRHGMIGVWTDDASMGLCMADSILLNDYHFNPINIRYLFNLWLHHGLNNGGRPYSIGLGGNIAISMDEFMHRQQPYTDKGDRFNNGNGSLMRLAPIPVAFSDNLEKGVEFSGLSSETTHNGYQASECCRLMGKIIIELINRPENADGKQVLKQTCDNFVTDCKSVYNLARAQCDEEALYKSMCQANNKFKKFNKSINDRNWNWRDKNHTYSPTRLKQQPGYIGSYCMDALAMALHTVWQTKSFKEVAIKNADMGGDCDTVGSIAGQIAGAIYGVDEEMLKLYSQMHDFTKQRYEVFVKGYKLINKKLLK